MTVKVHSSSERPQTGEKKPRRPTTPLRKLRRMLSRTALRLPIIWYRHHGFRTGEKSGFRVVDATLRGVSKHPLGKRVLPGGGKLISTHEQYRDWKRYHK